MVGNMHTIQIMTCWLGNSKDTPQYARHIQWLEFMDKLRGNLHFSDIYFVDNASDLETLKSLGGEILDVGMNVVHEATTRPHLHCIHFEEFLDRVSIWDYPYVFRAFRFIPTIIKNINPDKVLFIDTDFYPLTQKIVDKVNLLDTGFQSLKDTKYGFMEAAFSVLCRDTFDKYFDFCLKSNFDELKVKGTIEDFMPFTGIIEGVVGGRYGEQGLVQENEDYYGQNTGQEMIFKKY